jgi:acyl carrier protein
MTQERTPDEVEAWLIARLREALALPEGASIETDRPLADLGLDSRGAIGLTGDAEEWLDVDLDPTMFFDHPTIERLAVFLVAEAAENGE